MSSHRLPWFIGGAPLLYFYARFLTPRPSTKSPRALTRQPARKHNMLCTMRCFLAKTVSVDAPQQHLKSASLGSFIQHRHRDRGLKNIGGATPTTLGRVRRDRALGNGQRECARTTNRGNLKTSSSSAQLVQPRGHLFNREAWCATLTSLRKGCPKQCQLKCSIPARRVDSSFPPRHTQSKPPNNLLFLCVGDMHSGGC